MKYTNIIRTALSLILALVMCFSLSVTAFADSDKNPKKNEETSSATDSSQTHLYFQENGEKAPFSKQNIAIYIDGNRYDFNESGNNSWLNASVIGELDISNEESIDVTIICGSDKYTATLTNHSDANGNNKNDKNGTDTYNISGIQLVVPAPTPAPSAEPTAPSTEPTATPSSQPSEQPAVTPSAQPSTQPTVTPSAQPSEQPAATPSAQPSEQPTATPSAQPSEQPAVTPSAQPSEQPTATPSSQPSEQPAVTPSAQPSEQPAVSPSAQPSEQPTATPSAPAVEPILPMSEVSEEKDEEPEEVEEQVEEELEEEEEDYEEDDEIVILDEEIPLAEVPQTGDESTILLLLVLLSGVGLVVLNTSRKKSFHF